MTVSQNTASIVWRFSDMLAPMRFPRYTSIRHGPACCRMCPSGVCRRWAYGDFRAGGSFAGAAAGAAASFIVGGARSGINQKPPQSSTAASNSGTTIARQTTMTTVFTRFEDMGYFPFGFFQPLS